MVTEFLPNLSGVLQGSVLGPLLFLIFINDIGSILQHSSDMIFADDLQIYSRTRPQDIGDAISRLNVDARSVSEWATSNGLQLNVGKTDAIILGSSAYLSQLAQSAVPPIEIDGRVVPYVQGSVRNLGVHISANLTWNTHVAQVSRRVYASIHRLKQHRELISLSK